MEKRIEGFEDYAVTTSGDIISYKKGRIVMKQWVDSKGRYMQIALCNNGVIKKFLVHRLVGKAFIPNPNDFPEIDHKDNNPQNNNVENLRWCTRKFNARRSFETMSPVRNFRTCKLYYYNKLVGNFKSVTEASKFASKEFGASKTGLQKYGVSKNCKLIKNL